MNKIGFVVEKRYLRQEMTRGVVGFFKANAAQVDLLSPQDCQFEPETGLVRTMNGSIHDLRSYDVIVPRVRSPLGMALLFYADTARIPVVNGYYSIQRARNKTQVAVALAHAKVHAARTLLADDASVLAGLPENWYPLILKSVYGDNSQGLRLIRKREELDLVSWNDELVLAQQYLPNDGFDLKLYVCGERVFATRKPSPFSGDPRQPIQAIEPDSRLTALALQVKSVLGLEILGIDAIETPEGPVVIEVNDFPNFTGVPGAAEHIAEHILAKVNKSTLGFPKRSMKNALVLHRPAVRVG